MTVQPSIDRDETIQDLPQSLETAPVYESIWECPAVALQRVMAATGATRAEVERAICQAVADGAISFRAQLMRHSNGMTSSAVLNNSAFEVLAVVKWAHLDGQESRPAKPWLVKRGAYKLPGTWYLARIELLKTDVSKILCTPQGQQSEGSPSTSAENQTMRTALNSPKRRRGRRLTKRIATIEAMREDIALQRLTPAELGAMLEKHLKERYHVSRDTARKARDSVLSK